MATCRSLCEDVLALEARQERRWVDDELFILSHQITMPYLASPPNRESFTF